MAAIQNDRAEQWVRYGRSCSGDTRLALCMPSLSSVNEKAHVFLADKGVGLYRCSTADFLEALPPRDLAFNLELPELRDLSSPLRRVLGPVYEKFDRGDWREGFQEACLVLESEARLYLRSGIKSSRIKILDDNGNPRNPRVRDIDRMTLGQLGHAFSRIESQNHTDSLLTKALPQINPDRIGVVHKKLTARTERRLRENVGRNMWTVINCLRQIK
jgi:hypothetical protein